VQGECSGENRKEKKKKGGGSREQLAEMTETGNNFTAFPRDLYRRNAKKGCSARSPKERNASC